jgi:hypothetical protein
MLEFTNCTFLIPYKNSNSDRENNLLHVLRYLNTFFKTNVVIVEQKNNTITNTLNIINSKQFNNISLIYKQYNSGHDLNFHKTKLYNLGMQEIQSEIVIPYDADVLIPISQLIEARNNIIFHGYDYCFPFNGNYIEISKLLPNNREAVLNNYDFETYKNSASFMHEENSKKRFSKIPGIIRGCPPGGCIFIKKQVYIDFGLENEEFHGYAPEDVERKDRLHKLGYRGISIDGDLYHIEHHTEDRRIASLDAKRLYADISGMDINAIKDYYSKKNYKNIYGLK